VKTAAGEGAFMRELTEVEVVAVSGGAVSAKSNYMPVFDSRLFKQLHAEIQKEMRQVVIEMHDNAKPFS